MKPPIRDALDRLALEVQSDQGQGDLVAVERGIIELERDLELAAEIARGGLENAFRNARLTREAQAVIEEFMV